MNENWDEFKHSERLTEFTAFEVQYFQLWADFINIRILLEIIKLTTTVNTFCLPVPYDILLLTQVTFYLEYNESYFFLPDWVLAKTKLVSNKNQHNQSLYIFLNEEIVREETDYPVITKEDPLNQEDPRILYQDHKQHHKYRICTELLVSIK